MFIDTLAGAAVMALQKRKPADVTESQIGDMDDVAEFGCAHVTKNGADLRSLAGNLEPVPLQVPRAWGFGDIDTDTCGW